MFSGTLPRHRWLAAFTVTLTAAAAGVIGAYSGTDPRPAAPSPQPAFIADAWAACHDVEPPSLRRPCVALASLPALEWRNDAGTVLADPAGTVMVARCRRNSVSTRELYVCLLTAGTSSRG